MMFIMNEIHCILSGRVQMVMFRDFAQRKARGLGLVGWVRNLPDGTVEVVAQGERAALECFVEKLHRGSLLSRVAEVQAVWGEAREPHQGFEIRF